MISVVIPVKNGGAALRHCLDGIARQQLAEEVEVVVIDSESTDESPALAKAFGARVISISAQEFNHGGTRNLGARASRGELLVFTSQDAYPDSEHWLRRLTTPLHEREELAGVYGRQLAHEDASPAERYFLDFLYGPHPRFQRAASMSELSMKTTLFSNANAAIRRTVWERFPFVDDIIMSEDQEWSTRVLVAGYGLVYEPEAVVRHSHAYSMLTAFRRFFDSGVSAERSYLAGAKPSAGVLRNAALRYAAGELRWLWSTGQKRWIPYTAAYELAKFAGLQLGARHRHLPLWLKLRCTALPSYWRPPTATLARDPG